MTFTFCPQGGTNGKYWYALITLPSPSPSGLTVTLSVFDGSGALVGRDAFTLT